MESRARKRRRSSGYGTTSRGWLPSRFTISEQTKNLMDLDCAEWALVSDSAQAILSKSAGEMGPT